MIQLPDERRPPLSPQLAVRVAVLGGVALTLFVIIFFRLWFLQVLSGDRYLAQAQNNQERRVVLQAPRGTILDRNGNVLVDNRAAMSIQAVPARLPTSQRRLGALYRRLAHLLGSSAAPHRCQVARTVIHVSDLRCQVERLHDQIPFASVPLEPDATRAQYSYLLEHQAQFPGITAEPSYLRRYPFHGLAAQLFGTVGQINALELKDSNFRGVGQGTVVGQSGVEYAYDRYLRGVNGYERISVDSQGNTKAFRGKRSPEPGKTLRMSIDLGLQREGQHALDVAQGLAQSNGNPGGGGAFVALDPRNGEVLGLGSSPTFDPNVFAKPITQRRYQALFGKDANYPQVDRAIAGAYPTGSTMKMVTATAALQSGAIAASTVVDDPGSVVIGRIRFQNAGGAANGAVDLRTAIKVSSDVYFYKLGAAMNTARPQGGALQLWARRFGLGHKTGIDLPGEAPGNFPSPAWRARRNGLERACEKRHHNRPCGIASPDLRPWTIGDNVNSAVGQGDVLASPLQMAVAYSALVNGGRVVRPHVGLQVEDAVGKVVQRLDRPPARHIAIDPANRQAILDGLHLAASSPGGTSADVFRGFPKPVYGKTGTAQRPNQADQSWYVCYVPDPVKPIIVAVTIEKGGFGAQAAAPAARLILSQWFGLRKKVVAGSSKTL